MSTLGPKLAQLVEQTMTSIPDFVKQEQCLVNCLVSGKSSILSKSTKIRIFKSNVIAVLLYGCESWRMTKGDEAKLDTFQHKCLGRLLKIYWPMRMSNEEVRRRANTETISELVRKRRWTWIGHVLRMDNSCLPRVALI